MDKHFFVFKHKKLTVEKGRITLSVTEVEKPMKAEGEPDGEQAGKFKRYVLAIIYKLLQYVPVTIEFLLELSEVNQC